MNWLSQILGYLAFLGGREHVVEVRGRRAPMRRSLIGMGVLVAGWLVCPLIPQASAVKFFFDYRFDSNGFFDPSSTFADGSSGADRRERLAAAGRLIGDNLADDLLPIQPGGGNSWRVNFFHPGTGDVTTVTDLMVDEDTIHVIVGGRSRGDGFLGFAHDGSITSLGGSTRDFIGSVRHRGEGPAGTATFPTDEFGPWGGVITFNDDIVINVNNVPTSFGWHFGETVAGLDNTKFDFLSVGLHELGHLLGFGNADSWLRYRNLGGNPLGTDNHFSGPHAMAAFGGEVPLQSTADPHHWLPDLDGDTTAFDSTLRVGVRSILQPVDWAALADIGWEPMTIPEPSALSSIVISLACLVLVARRNSSLLSPREEA